MMSVAELDGLFAGDVSASVVRRPLKLRCGPDNAGDDKDCTENANPGDCIGTAVKCLSHLVPESKTFTDAVDINFGKLRNPQVTMRDRLFGGEVVNN